MKQTYFFMCVALLLLVISILTGCGNPPEENPDPNWYGEGTVAHKLEYTDCYYLKIYDEKNLPHETCVSEDVWRNAMLGHHINITKEYH